MGLDMYLEKRRYVKNWEHMKDEQKHEVIVKLGGKVVESIKPERVSQITEQVMYWRKANHIHNWFVTHVQGGEDNCGDFYVSKESLTKLLRVCKFVLENSELVDGKIRNRQVLTVDVIEDGKKVEDSTVAEQYLPTSSGCFFGGTDYDEYYISDTKDTIEALEKLLEEDDGVADYYYSSSW